MAGHQTYLDLTPEETEWLNRISIGVYEGEPPKSAIDELISREPPLIEKMESGKYQATYKGNLVLLSKAK